MGKGAPSTAHAPTATAAGVLRRAGTLRPLHEHLDSSRLTVAAPGPGVGGAGGRGAG